MSSPIAARHARRVEARRLALQLMAQHGLHDWNFAFNRRKRSMGLYRSGLYRDTILHEIAHALVGTGHGPDTLWKRKCIEVGAKPQRCGQADMPAGRWQARRSCGPERGKLA